MELLERVALVTGGAIRVGKAIALALADRGAHVGFTYHSSAGQAVETLAELRRRGVRAHAVQCDQRNPEQVEAAIRELEGRLGAPSVLVNSAAIFHHTPFETATLEDWNSHLEVNLRGPWLFAKSVAPGMRERGEGVIVNIIDIAAERPFPGYLPYSISKAGVAALTRGLAHALAPQVRVLGISPGEVMWPEGFPEEQKQYLISKAPLKREGSPEDIARAVVFMVEGSDYLTGAILPVDGGRSVV